jgi:ubiquitin-like protein Pup
MDEINDVLDTNAEEFVRAYVQNGGQGWTGFLDPAFFAGAVSAGVVAGATWDGFKLVVKKAIHALRQAPGPSTTSLLIGDDGDLEEGFASMLRAEWEMNEGILAHEPSGHTVDDAIRFHWMLFFGELLRSERLIRLEPAQYRVVAEAADATPEHLSVAQMVSRIIHQWAQQHPNSGIGLV